MILQVVAHPIPPGSLLSQGHCCALASWSGAHFNKSLSTFQLPQSLTLHIRHGWLSVGMGGNGGMLLLDVVGWECLLFFFRVQVCSYCIFQGTPILSRWTKKHLEEHFFVCFWGWHLLYKNLESGASLAYTITIIYLGLRIKMLDTMTSNQPHQFYHDSWSLEKTLRDVL